MKRKKLLALLLACAMVLSLAACGGTEPTEGTTAAPGGQDTTAAGGQDTTAGGQDTTAAGDQETTPAAGNTGSGNENKVILGDITEMTGDFRYPGWGASSVNAADQGIGFLTIGAGTMEIDQNGAYVWSQTVVKNHTETENEDGTYTIQIELNEGLTFSDGTPITAKNYLAKILAFSTPVAVETGHSGMAGQTYVGFESFNAYAGEEAEGATKEFSGIRLLDEHTFSVTISSDFYPYYFAYTYAAMEPHAMGLFLGEGVDIMDDGNGVYLSDSFYEKSGDSFVKAKEISDNRYDVSKYPYSGAYVISDYDASTKQVTMTINPLYKGNFEGQTPSIETVVYVKIIEETQLASLTSGGIDILSSVTGGDSTKEALAVVDDVNFSEVHYQRAGYGKIQFDCDFGPTMFQEVRQAIAYLLNRTEFCQTFTGGYGVVVDGPFSPDFAMWQAVRDDIDLIDYTFSPEQAKKVLEEGGWVYNSKGEAYAEGGTGVDSVRYKKLTAEEAEVLEGRNKTYESVANDDGVVYKTVEINGEYYMPLVINWYGSLPNSVTDLLTTMLSNSSDLAAAGMVIRSTTGEFTKLQGEIYREPTYGYNGTPSYGMYNLATGWPSSVYDYAFNWSLDPNYFPYSVNKLYDEYDKAFPYDQKADKLSYEEAVEASGDKLGMDYLSMAMVYNATTEEEYNQWWMAYIERWNELMPDIPLYSSYYYDVYNSKIENFNTSPFFNQCKAILYANVKGY